MAPIHLFLSDLQFLEKFCALLTWMYRPYFHSNVHTYADNISMYRRLIQWFHMVLFYILLPNQMLNNHRFEDNSMIFHQIHIIDKGFGTFSGFK